MRAERDEAFVTSILTPHRQRIEHALRRHGPRCVAPKAQRFVRSDVDARQSHLPGRADLGPARRRGAEPNRYQPGSKPCAAGPAWSFQGANMHDDARLSKKGPNAVRAGRPTARTQRQRSRDCGIVRLHGPQSRLRLIVASSFAAGGGG